MFYRYPLNHLPVPLHHGPLYLLVKGHYVRGLRPSGNRIPSVLPSEPPRRGASCSTRSSWWAMSEGMLKGPSCSIRGIHFTHSPREYLRTNNLAHGQCPNSTTDYDFDSFWFDAKRGGKSFLGIGDCQHWYSRRRRIHLLLQ